ncbi:MAG: AAA family ATPase, partial [Synergistaceae bacterium]|nr:AAA family ATPase [Synergistaceae bacterium]
MEVENMQYGPLPKLPIGIQDFEIIRSEGYLYVDKTKYLVDLIDRGKVYFISRPRRFGKSLTVSAFDALFSGRRELFKGLYAQEFMDRPEFTSSPVVHLDMSRTVTNRGLDELEESISEQFYENARRYDVDIGKSLPSILLTRLLGALAQKIGRVAVLVD